MFGGEKNKSMAKDNASDNILSCTNEQIVSKLARENQFIDSKADVQNASNTSAGNQLPVQSDGTTQYMTCQSEDKAKLNKEIEIEFLRGKSEIAPKGSVAPPKLMKTNLIYDSIEEEEEELSKVQYLYAPNIVTAEYKLQLFFQSIFSIVVVIHVCITSVNISFNPYAKQLHTDSSEHDFSEFDLYYFIFEILILLEFIISLVFVYDNENRLSIQAKALLKAYRKENFIIDFLTAFPFSIIYSSATINPAYLGYICSLRWLKLLCVIRFNYCFNKLSIYNDYLAAFKGLISLINYCLYFHFTSCLWIYVSMIQYYKLSNGWIKFYFGNGSSSEIYLASIYFNFTTLFTVGYGDITAKNKYEYVFSVFLLIISCLVYANLFSSISVKFTSTERRYEIIEMKKRTLQSYDRTSCIPETLKLRILHFYKKSLSIGVDNKNYLLDVLPFKLRNELQHEMYGSIVSNLKFFHGSKPEFCFYILNYLKPITIEKGELLLEVDSCFSDMIFVVKGQLDFFLASNQKYARFFSLMKGDNFGEINILTGKAVNYRISSSKRKNSDLLLLSKDKLIDLRNFFALIFKEKLKNSLRLYKLMEKNKDLYTKKYMDELKGNQNYVINFPDISSPTNLNLSSPLIKKYKNTLINNIEVKAVQDTTNEMDNELFIDVNSLIDFSNSITYLQGRMERRKIKTITTKKKDVLISNLLQRECDSKCFHATKKIFREENAESSNAQFNSLTNGIRISRQANFKEDFNNLNLINVAQRLDQFYHYDLKEKHESSCSDEGYKLPNLKPKKIKKKKVAEKAKEFPKSLLFIYLDFLKCTYSTFISNDQKPKQQVHSILKTNKPTSVIKPALNKSAISNFGYIIGKGIAKVSMGKVNTLLPEEAIKLPKSNFLIKKKLTFTETFMGANNDQPNNSIKFKLRSSKTINLNDDKCNNKDSEKQILKRPPIPKPLSCKQIVHKELDQEKDDASIENFFPESDVENNEIVEKLMKAEGDTSINYQHLADKAMKAILNHKIFEKLKGKKTKPI